MTEEIEELDPEIKTNHYVDSKLFKEAMIKQVELYKNSEEKPQVTDYIAKCFLDISTHLAYRRNFSGYSYKEEMIMDGVEVCLRYWHNYNPEKGPPFAYFNRLCWQAFVNRIKKEKHEQKIKGRLILEYSVDSLFEDSDDMESDINNHVIEYIKENSFIDMTEEPVRKKREVPYVRSGVEIFMAEESDES